MNKEDLYDYGLFIYQNKDYFKFSLDSILLAEFIEFKKEQKILDLCTGNAPIPLILSTKDKTIKIDCVEIQKEIYDLAKKSIDENNLSNLIKIYNKDAKTFESTQKYDIISCNPPYFTNIETSLKNENNVKALARHEILINIDEIVKICKRLLSETGSVYIVHRPEKLFEIEEKFNNNGFGIRKICFIFTKEDTNAKLVLIKADKNKKTDIKYEYRMINNLKTFKNLFWK